MRPSRTKASAAGTWISAATTRATAAAWRTAVSEVHRAGTQNASAAVTTPAWPRRSGRAAGCAVRPSALPRRRRRRGYQVVLMSEHSCGFTAAKWDDYRQACADASTDRVLLETGIEYGDEDDVVHILSGARSLLRRRAADRGPAEAGGCRRRHRGLGASVVADGLAALQPGLVGVPGRGRGVEPEVRRHRAETPTHPGCGVRAAARRRGASGASLNVAAVGRM